MTCAAESCPSCDVRAWLTARLDAVRAEQVKRADYGSAETLARLEGAEAVLVEALAGKTEA